jgi:hypothetical protein
MNEILALIPTGSQLTDLIGLFIFIAGFIIGLGAVTVIDWHGFLGTRSVYWTETTIRAHKITKPLIWVGTILAIVGGSIFYRALPFAGIPKIHALLALILVANGCFLSFVVSPTLLRRERTGHARELLPRSLQIKIALSFVISFTGWWLSVFLLCLHLITR